MAKGRIYWLAYSAAGRADRILTTVHSRDGVAGMYLESVLYDHGFRFADPLVNYPPEGAVCGKQQLFPYDHGFLRPSDLLLLCTRPPMDDDVPVQDDATHARRKEKPARKASVRSCTTLEENVFRTIRRWVPFSGRTRTGVCDEAARLSVEIAERQCCDFRQNGGPDYTQYGPLNGRPKVFRKRPNLTAAYLVYAEHAWPGGPALLAVWGMAALETMVWCRYLAHARPDLLRTTAFAFAELRTVEHPDRAPVSFADDWPIRILGTAPIKTCSPDPGASGPLAAVASLRRR